MRSKWGKILGVDADDTLWDWETHWKQWHTNNYGSEILPWHTPEGLRRGHEFIVSKHHEAISANEGAIETLELLKSRRTLVIITARDSLHSSHTLKLIESNFPDTFRDVHFLHHNLRNVLGSKADVCKAHGIEEHIDDDVPFIEKVRDIGVQPYLFTTPRNKNVEVPGVIRVHSWKEMLEHVV